MGENKVIAASMWGKAKTVSQFILVLAVMVFEAVIAHWPAAAVYCEPAILVMAIAAVGLTVYSGFDYIWKNRSMITFK